MKYYLVLNEQKYEGFVTTDKTDALIAAGKKKASSLCSAMASDFADMFDDEERTITEIEIP